MATVHIDNEFHCNTVGKLYFIRPGLVAFLGMLYIAEMNGLAEINDWLGLAAAIFGWALVVIALNMAAKNNR